MIILENIRMKISRITSQDRIEAFLHSVNSFTGKFGGNLVIRRKTVSFFKLKI